MARIVDQHLIDVFSAELVVTVRGQDVDFSALQRNNVYVGCAAAAVDDERQAVSLFVQAEYKTCGGWFVNDVQYLNACVAEAGDQDLLLVLAPVWRRGSYGKFGRLVVVKVRDSRCLEVT